MKRFLLIPSRVTALLAHRNSRALKIILMVLVLITALYTKEYRGEYARIINTNIGGVFYVLFGSLLFSVLFPKMKFFWPVIIAFVITCSLEVIQYFRFQPMVELTRNKTMAYLFGTSFNPVDFIYYLVGAAVALAVLAMMKEEKSFDEL